jgi:hypothetical protein
LRGGLQGIDHPYLKQILQHEIIWRFGCDQTPIQFDQREIAQGRQKRARNG